MAAKAGDIVYGRQWCDWTKIAAGCGCGNLERPVPVQFSWATSDLWLIQQNKFYWISHRSIVAQLNCTVTERPNGLYAFWNAKPVHAMQGVVKCGHI